MTQRKSRRMKIAIKTGGAGIYMIRNRISGDCYIGSSILIRWRISEHKRDLSLGEHHSRFLQRAWNKYGPDAFEFSVLEKTKPNAMVLQDTEQRYLDLFRPRYNMSQKSDRPSINYPPDPATRARRAASMRRVWADPHFREKRTKAMSEMFASSEWRAKNTASIRARWQDNAYRNRMLATWKMSHDNHAYRKAISETQKTVWSDPKYRAAMIEKRKAKWQDPDYRAMMLDARRKGRAKRDKAAT